MSRDLAVYVNYEDTLLKINSLLKGEVTEYLWDNEPLDFIFGGYGNSPEIPLRGLPDNCPYEVLEMWKDYANSGLCTWFDFCELSALSRTPEAMLINWDEIEDSGIDIYNTPKNEWPRYNALKRFVERVELLLELNGIYYPKPGEVTVICCLSV